MIATPYDVWTESVSKLNLFIEMPFGMSDLSDGACLPK